MLQSFRSIVAMLEGERRLLGPAHPNLAASRQAQIVHFKQIIASLMPDPTAAASMYEELNKEGCIFNDDERKVIGEAVASHSRSGNALTDASDKQVHMHFHNYMTEALWAEQLRGDIDLDSKLNAMARFAQKTVGLVRCHETTYAALTAITLRASGCMLDPTQAKAKVEQLKRFMASLRKQNNPVATFKDFPENVDDFIQVYPNHYDPGHPAVPPRVPVQDLMDMRNPDIVPCRGSARSLKFSRVSSTAHSHGAAASRSNQMLLHTGGMQQPAQHMMGGMSQPSQMDAQQVMQLMMQTFGGMMQFMTTGQPPQQTPIPNMQYFFGGNTSPPRRDQFPHASPPRRDEFPHGDKRAESPLSSTPETTAIEVDTSRLAGGVLVPVHADDNRSKVHKVLADKAAAAKRKKKSGKRKPTPMKHCGHADEKSDSDDDVESSEKDCEDDEDDDEEECVTKVSKKRPASAVVPKGPAAKGASKVTSIVAKHKETKPDEKEIVDKHKKTKPSEKEKHTKAKPSEKETKDMKTKFKQFFLKKDAMTRSYGAFTTRASKGVGSLLGTNTSKLAYAVAADVWKQVHSSS